MDTHTTQTKPSTVGVGSDGSGSGRSPLSSEAAAFHAELWEWLGSPLTEKHLTLGAKKAELCDKYGHGALAELEIYFQCNPNIPVRHEGAPPRSCL